MCAKNLSEARIVYQFRRSQILLQVQSSHFVHLKKTTLEYSVENWAYIEQWIMCFAKEFHRSVSRLFISLKNKILILLLFKFQISILKSQDICNVT